jgi:hypothetical protein
MAVQGVYSENGSMFLAPGYGYTSQPTYTPYPPVMPVPTIGADGQFYGPQTFQYPKQAYQQPLSPGGQYIASPSAMGAGEVTTPGAIEPGPPGVDGSNGALANGNKGPRPGFPAVTVIPSHASYGRGVLPLAFHPPGPQDVRYEGLRAGAPSWVDVSKVSEGPQQPVIPASIPPVVSQPLRPITALQIHVQTPQQLQTPPTLGSPNLTCGTLARGYLRSAGLRNGPFVLGRAGHAVGSPGVESKSAARGGWIGVDKGKHRGRGGGPSSNGNGGLDFLNEQNRGPRTIRIRNQLPTPGVLQHTRGQGAISSGNSEALEAIASKEQYNQPDFITNYESAKFFVIKSYSEDDVHKSIKYNVWASTPVGNKRLDAAFKDASGKAVGGCPVFLFFSVNASGQFCGVAEMTGPVDFTQSVEYWQQDKWNGRFTVKWHIIKDIPNCQFRHIILENNDNKPVTNSRDTQEVRFEQGIEMLSIFKGFPSKTSILDDFQFYENRQQALQEKRARQHAQQQQEQLWQGGVCNVGIGSNEACIEETSPQLEQEEPSKIPAADTNVGHKVTEPSEANSCSSTPSIDGSKDSYDSSAMLGSAIDKRSPTSRVELNGDRDEKVTRKGDSQPETEKIVEMVESVQDLSISSTGGVVEDNKS